MCWESGPSEQTVKFECKYKNFDARKQLYLKCALHNALILFQGAQGGGHKGSVC